VGGQSVDINVQIDPVIDGNGVWNNLVLHAAIFEYTTFNNASSNGEFEFYNIMKKMVPDISGTSITNLLPNIPQNINLSYTFNGQYLLPPDADSPIDHSLGHTVEDFNNLGVAVWLQDVDTKYILQSTEASLVADIHENKEKKLLCFPNPSSGTLHLILPEFTGQYNIEMYSLTGEKVYESDITNQKNQLNLDFLQSGIYQLKVFNHHSSFIKKVEILR
jgi:hypothetical protein